MHNKILFLTLALICFVMAGCATLDKIAPINPETGFREPTQLTQEVAGAVPYGSGAWAVLLFISNSILLVKKRKTDQGLWATVKAIEQASKDPEMKDMVAKLKIQLAAAHKEVNVSPLINRLLSRIKFG